MKELFWALRHELTKRFPTFDPAFREHTRLPEQDRMHLDTITGLVRKPGVEWKQSFPPARPDLGSNVVCSQYVCVEGDTTYRVCHSFGEKIPGRYFLLIDRAGSQTHAVHHAQVNAKKLFTLLEQFAADAYIQKCRKWAGELVAP